MRVRRPDCWLGAGLFLLTALGTAALMHPACKVLSERDVEAYWFRHLWQTVFDVLSAACGVGLMTYDWEHDLTSVGRVVLLSVGVCGAVMFLWAAAAVAQKLRSATSGPALPGAGLVLFVFGLLVVLSVGVVGVVERVAGGSADVVGAVMRGCSAVCSLGWLHGAPAAVPTWFYGALALVGGLGWPVWLLVVPALRKRYLYVPRVLWIGATYVAVLFLAGVLLFAFESPRGGRAPSGTLQGLPGAPAPERLTRCLAQSVAAAAAGIPTEDLRERAVTDGSKLTLCGLLLIGPLGGAAGGGIKWALLLWVLAGLGAALGPGGARTTQAGTLRCLWAGVLTLITLAGLVVVVAIGLLLIENATASLFQSRPSLADALLDASSAVNGGNLTSGLAARVTNLNLSSGIRQGVDQYQYGMVWLMLAMFLGRVLPLLMVRRLAEAAFHDRPHGTSPWL